MFKIAICDDLKEEREKLIALLDEYFEGKAESYKKTEFSCGENIIREYEDGAEGFDLIFMDIFMGGINGFDTSKVIRNYDKNVPIAFLTITNDFAVDSYDIEAAGYFLKPVQKKRLFALLDRKTAVKDESPILEFKRRGMTRFYKFSDIVYIESSGHTVFIHMADGSDDNGYYKIDDLPLTDERFLRCHKSYLVNMDYIKYADDDFIMTTGAHVPIRTHGHKEVVDAYTNYFVNKHVGGNF